MKRREFLKKVFQLGGLAAVHQLGMGAVEDAMGWGIFPGVMEGGGASYKAWQQDSQNTIAADFCIFHDGPAGGANTKDIGYSDTNVLSGEGLNWASPAAISAGYPRDLDGNTEYFTLNTGLRDLLKDKETWTIIFKVSAWNPTEDFEALMYWGAATDLVMRANEAANRNMSFIAQGVTIGGAVTANAFSVLNVLYIALWSSAADNVTRAGFLEIGAAADTGTSHPKKWSDFPANNRVSTASSTVLSTMTEGDPEVYRDAVNNNREMKAKVYWSIWDRSCLIDNNA